MSTTTTTKQIMESPLDPAIEAYRLGLLSDARGLTRDQMFGQSVQDLKREGVLNPVTNLPYTDEEIFERLGSVAQVGEVGDENYVAPVGPQMDLIQGVTTDQIYSPPDYQVQELTDSEKAAIGMAAKDIGAYQPYLTSGSQSLQAGTGAIADSALPYMQQGISALAGSADQFDPSGIAAYMSPYEDDAVQQALADITRQGEIQRTQLDANAVASGAFGGSRQGIADAELTRNVLEQQGRTAADMRRTGYESAAARAQDAFERAKGRTQQASQLYGSIGEGIGGLGGRLGQLGIQQAGLGELRTGLGSQDLQNLMSTGALKRGVDQAGLDALRMSNLQAYSQPYQQYGFLSDIYSGIPTSSSTITATSAPQTSPFQSALGLGIAGLSAASGAQRAGLL
tara:strand:+ start:541 stop:1731 length:1191 start_codon:yes stop_codon:yes gene_type:complete